MAAFDPPAALKASYRAIAKELHPDLAATDEERGRRTELMAKVNAAYRRQDQDALDALLEEWNMSPEAVSGEGIAMDLVRVIRQIAQVGRRLEEIAAATGELKASNLYELYGEYRQQLESGRNLLEEMAARLDTQIAEAQQDLDQLRRETA